MFSFSRVVTGCARGVSYELAAGHFLVVDYDRQTDREARRSIARSMGATNRGKGESRHGCDIICTVSDWLAVLESSIELARTFPVGDSARRQQRPQPDVTYRQSGCSTTSHEVRAESNGHITSLLNRRKK